MKYRTLIQLLFKTRTARAQSYNEVRSSERPLRSIVKALSWRCIGTLDTLIVSYILTQKIGIAASIAAVDFISKMMLYFFHERIWNLIKWQRYVAK